MARNRSRTPVTPVIPASPRQAQLLQTRGELQGALLKFEACLPTPRRTSGRLGVKLNRIDDDKLEIATAADENDVVRPGLVAEWNKQQAKHAHQRLRIRPGDRITAINHSPDYISMLEELDQAPHVTLSIERDRPGVLLPGFRPGGLSLTSQSRPSEKSDGLSSRRPLLPPLPPVKCEKPGARRPSISESSTREPTPRTMIEGKYFSPNVTPGEIPSRCAW